MDGIVRNHCYTVLEYCPQEPGWQSDWIKLRNPWGFNPRYTVGGDATYTRSKEPAWLATGQAELADGVFYMRFSEFTSIFSKIDYED